MFFHSLYSGVTETRIYIVPHKRMGRDRSVLRTQGYTHAHTHTQSHRDLTLNHYHSTQDELCCTFTCHRFLSHSSISFLSTFSFTYLVFHLMFYIHIVTLALDSCNTQCINAHRKTCLRLLYSGNIAYHLSQ